jgi:radical SAM protein with 4Fe4S-binding SPASM domain
MSDTEQKPVLDLEISDGGYTKDLYKNINCMVGYRYIRFETTGDVKPCCIYPAEVGNINKNDWREVWMSGAMSEFRAKTGTMAQEQRHLYDPEWSFCQQCSHRGINLEVSDDLKSAQKHLNSEF